MESREKLIWSQGAPLPRLGQIAYINSLPITLPLTKGLVPINAQVEFASPSELNQAYSSGHLDIGAMSTFFYLQSGTMSLIPRLSIASNGNVGSVLFFHRGDDQRNPKVKSTFRIAVPAASATSVFLLKILFLSEFGYIPETVKVKHPDLSDQAFDGALVIGDHALAVDASWSGRFSRVDMGNWWKLKFDLPMVFGVWAARSAWAESRLYDFKRISDGLVASLEIGLGEAFPDVLAEAERRTGLSRTRLERYYRHELDFSFTDCHLKSVHLYETLCYQHGFLSSPLAFSRESSLGASIS